MLLEFDAELTATKSQIRDVEDREILANIGYKQELKRSFSLISMVGFTFSMLTSWCALAASLAEVMQNGGPAVLVYGWIGVCVLTMCVVIVLAELCSAYPVAGGQYSWCLLLAKGTKWGRAVSFICGWIQLSGIVGMVAVGSYQFGTQVAAIASLNHPSYVPTNWSVALIAYGSALFALLVGMFGLKILNHISTVSLWWSVGGFIICIVTVLSCAPKFEPPAFTFTTVTTEGWSNVGMAVVVGLCQPAYGMCSYDSVAHLAEETEDAPKQSPRAMVMSVIIGFITGFGLILAALFSIQDLEAVVNTPTGLPLLEIFYQATSSKAGASCLVVVVCTCQMFTNIALTTNASRSIYASARDGAFPFKLNKWLMYISPTLEVPVWGLIVAFGIACGLIAILFGSSTAFFTVLSIACTGLYISYLIPIVVYMIRWKYKAPGYYNLGKWAYVFMVPAILFLTFCIIFFFFPTQMPVTPGNMNYDIVAFGIALLLALISWFGGAKNTYVHDVGYLEGVNVPDNVLKATKTLEAEGRPDDKY